jgi:hypothetical protein
VVQQVVVGPAQGISQTVLTCRILPIWIISAQTKYQIVWVSVRPAISVAPWASNVAPQSWAKMKMNRNISSTFEAASQT